MNQKLLQLYFSLKYYILKKNKDAKSINIQFIGRGNVMKKKILKFVKAMNEATIETQEWLNYWFLVFKPKTLESSGIWSLFYLEKRRFQSQTNRSIAYMRGVHSIPYNFHYLICLPSLN